MPNPLDPDSRSDEDVAHAPAPVALPDASPAAATTAAPADLPRSVADGVPKSLPDGAAEGASDEAEGFESEKTAELRSEALADAAEPARDLRSIPLSRPLQASAEALSSAPLWEDSPEQAPLDEKTGDVSLLSLPQDAFDAEDDSYADEGATVEGAPLLDPRTDMNPLPPQRGATLSADDAQLVHLDDALGEQAGMVFFRARLGIEEQPCTAVWMLNAPPEPPWDRIPDHRLVRPRCRVSLERAAVRVFDRPKGNTVVDYLGDDEKLLPAMATLELGLELAELLESVHGAGHFIYDLDPSQIVIEKGGRVRMYAVSGLHTGRHLPHGVLGVFCAPEVRRRLGYRITAAADVYALALLVYALLAKRAPLDVDTDPAFLVSPRVFRPECPLGIWPYLRDCLDPNPLRRVGHARGLRERLEKARARLIAEARASDVGTAVTLEGWAEQHVGLMKARRGSGQQDRSLSVTDDGGAIGLYLVSDGVSRSRFGDGAFAAEQVETAALQRWDDLARDGLKSIVLDHVARSEALRQISRVAGKRIALEVNQRHAPLPNEPNQVMSATLVTAFIVDGDATIGNLGDSRAYLVREGTIEQISIDHDRITDALRLGLTFKEAAQVAMGTALTRVVGRVNIDDDGACRPDPFDPELFRVRLLPGDRLVLCSDGVADFVAGVGPPPPEQDRKILETIQQHPDPGRAAFELVVLANRVGGYDNISCVVVAVHGA